jgi:sulfoxide reductase catalytic subunit YedY
MAFISIRPPWMLPEHAVTPEAVHRRRREFLRHMGIAGAGLALSPSLVGQSATNPPAAGHQGAPRNPAFNPKLPLTPEQIVTHYNNFYEFSTQKDRVAQLVGRFRTSPWSVWIGGLCNKPMTLDFDDLLKVAPPEERVCRFRCVEAWSMVVPWTGFPLSKLLAKVEPTSDALYVKFTTALRPDEMPGVARLSDYPWPYTEGLRMDEAMHPLAFIATGLFSKPLPKQNGGPVRLVVPWKYGYKSIKSIVKIELVREQPATLWNALAPHEYPFESNVEPNVPHPRWSQATERDLATGNRIPTLPYNGYADQVASLYPRK